MLPDTPFDQIIARARVGDGAAWSELYAEVGSLVVGYLRSQRLPDPEDVAGEVFLQMVRDIHRFEGDRDQFRSWVVTIAHHRLVDDRRRARRRPSVPVAPEDLRPPAAPETAERAAMEHAAAEELEQRLAGLTEEQRTVLMLRVVGDLSLKECAQAMGKRVGAVKGLQHRAVEALRRELAAADGRLATSAADDVRSPRVEPRRDHTA
ncbi:MAG: RNA polymerase sigma factor [Actinobacteria bacterium]|nr:RNA polymerase sigma factor [Actinomycetota bacterium]